MSGGGEVAAARRLRVLTAVVSVAAILMVCGGTSPAGATGGPVSPTPPTRPGDDTATYGPGQARPGQDPTTAVALVGFAVVFALPLVCRNRFARWRAVRRFRIQLERDDVVRLARLLHPGDGPSDPGRSGPLPDDGGY